MKKLFISLLGIILTLLISLNQVKSLSVADFSPSLDKKIANMKTTEEKVKYLQWYADSLNTPKFTKSKNARLYKDIREYTLNMLTVFEYELKEEQSKYNSKTNSSSSSKNTISTAKTSTIIDLPHLSDNFSNIDEQKVRDTILSWHNEERKTI